MEALAAPSIGWQARGSVRYRLEEFDGLAWLATGEGLRRDRQKITRLGDGNGFDWREDEAGTN